MRDVLRNKLSRTNFLKQMTCTFERTSKTSFSKQVFSNIYETFQNGVVIEGAATSMVTVAVK